MQSRPKQVEPATDLQITGSQEDCLVAVDDDLNISQQLGASVQLSDPMRSYNNVYRTLRFALDHPGSWYAHRASRIQQSYGLPVFWSFVGCILGIGFVLLQQSLSPSVNLPSKREMTAVFALHDLNELLLVTNSPVRGKP